MSRKNFPPAPRARLRVLSLPKHLAIPAHDGSRGYICHSISDGDLVECDVLFHWNRRPIEGPRLNATASAGSRSARRQEGSMFLVPAGRWSRSRPPFSRACCATAPRDAPHASCNSKCRTGPIEWPCAWASARPGVDRSMIPIASSIGDHPSVRFARSLRDKTTAPRSATAKAVRWNRTRLMSFEVLSVDLHAFRVRAGDGLRSASRQRRTFEGASCRASLF